MRGEFVGVWRETWREIWQPMIGQSGGESDDGVGADVFCDLYRELATALRVRPSAQALAEVAGDPLRSREVFEKSKPAEFAGELALANFFEQAYGALEEFGGDGLSNAYFNLLAAFIEKFSLRYELRRPCVLCPTLPGMFASLIRNLKELTAADAHLSQLMNNYEEAVRDLRHGCTDGRIKTCIGKQFSLLEGIGAVDSGVTGDTLGAMCKQIKSWPHPSLKEALIKLYGFASDYPGVRHGARARGALRAIEMRDLIAMSILLTGFTPYLEGRLSAEAIYGGGWNPPAATQRAPAAQATAIAPGKNARSFLGKLFARALGAHP